MMRPSASHIRPRHPVHDAKLEKPTVTRPLPPMLLLGALATLLPAAALAQQPQRADTPRQVPDDLGYERLTPFATEEGLLPGGSLLLPPVDRRDAIDPLAVQGALLPTAHIPKARRVLYRNQLFFGHQLGARLTDRLWLDGTAVFPPGDFGSIAASDYDRMFGLHAKAKLFEGRDVSLALRGGFLYQKGLYDRDARTWNGQLNALLDYKLNDRLVLGTGLLYNLPWRTTLSEADLSQCPDRDAVLEGSCIGSVDTVQPWPVGGRFLLGWLGLTYYSPTGLSLKAEVFSAVRHGTILGLEGALFDDDSLESQRPRYQVSSRQLGLAPGNRIGLSFGMGYTLFERLAIQLALIAAPGAVAAAPVDNRDFDFPAIYPMSSVGLSF